MHISKSLLVFSLYAVLSSFICQSAYGEATMEFPTLKGEVIFPELDHLNVHLIAHTHDDIGWLKTVDQYYYDSNKSITIQGVQYILDSIVPALNIDPSKKFIYVEMGFFKRWWNEQSSTIQDAVKKLVQNGQLEFINGGYCMNDEAAVYYEDSIDQMTLGHQFLLDNFNYIPQIGWHIDPFGHAAAQAALFAQMGFNAFFFSRIDYQDKANRLADKGMEMIWIPNTSQGLENAMFTHINYYNYASPPGFDFDIISTDQPIMDDPRLEEYNVDQKADEFVAWFRQMETSYKATELLHTAGEDFHYMAAQVNFKNLDKLMSYIKAKPDYNIDFIYSTPSQYLKAIYPLGLTYPTKSDDFFPYADVESGYWTGYFTSRVAVKGIVRQEGRLLQAARRLATQLIWNKSSQFVMNNFAQVNQSLAQLEEAMAIGQHHDAVTGTEKQAVAENYKQYFAGGENAVKEGFLYPYLQEKIQADLGLQGAQLSTCNLNTSTVFCNVTYNNLGNGNSVLVVVFNSALVSRQSTIRVKVPNGNVQVTRTTRENLPTDIICANVTDSTDCDLFFTDTIQGLSTSYYYLVSSSTSNEISSQGLAFNQAYTVNANQTFTAQNMNTFSFNYCNNGASDCYNSEFSLNYNYYESYQSDGQKSGAYIFRPSQNTISGSIAYDSPLSGKVFIGKNLLQIQLYGAKTITSIRIYNDMTNGIEVQTFVDSINTSDGQGKEIVMVVQTPSIKNDNTFYTDSMGMEMQKRILNYRPTWNLQVTQPVSGNYYPVQSTIYIQDTTSNETLAIIPDRAQAGSSINSGEIELMIHRRLVDDDARGVGEPLNELDWDGNGMRQWVTHTLLFTKPGYISTSYRQVQLNNDMANLVFLAPAGKALFTEMVEDISRSPMSTMDPRIKWLCRPLSTTKLVLRFQNMDENDTLEVSTDVFASDSHGGRGSVVEMALSLNQAKSDMIKSRLNWNGLDLNNPAYANTDYLNSNQFSLRPLEIRSFIVQFSSSEEVISI